MPPEALAINHVQAPKVLKETAKMAVPTRKTMKPTILNLMKAKSHCLAFSPKPFLAELTELTMFIPFKKLFHSAKNNDIFKHSMFFF